MTVSVKLSGQSEARELPAASDHAEGLHHRKSVGVLITAAVAVFAVFIGALSAGRFHVPFNEVLRILIGHYFDLRQTWTTQEEQVVLGSRLPRVLLAMIVGGGLALAGATLQAVFRNPLVSPQVIGVSSGASFGGVIALLLGLGTFWLIGFSFAIGLLSIWIVISVGKTRSGGSILMIVLGGIVVSALFSALVSLVTTIADPYTTLPSIVFWLMGSLSAASLSKVVVALVPIALSATIVLSLRWRINVLSLGDNEARSLGINPQPLRIALLAMVALITAGAVAVSGVIGWVGLVVPHIARLLVGPDHRTLLPLSILIGAGYLALIDTLSRSVASAELPVGILTAVVGAPVFIWLLRVSHKNAAIED
ncbi:FecCD family ABC transporter permease [Corynebacterium ulceribovis]|uniref:FecCD family ABC transporter permease n=1 Tax=Corynebacterium ulceribovis TaxID=487732 RepID=UPI00035F69F5|nr:iron ABC transporter permease [Corynebacterium ulceribovis]